MSKAAAKIISFDYHSEEETITVETFETEEFMEWQRKWKPAPDMLERAIKNLPTMGAFHVWFSGL